MIPDTRISYPLVQGEDNQYYLNHTWKKWSSVVGAIFLECGNSRDLSNFNTIVYGHRMNDGSMFASLKNYRGKATGRLTPGVYHLMTPAAAPMRFFGILRLARRKTPTSCNFLTHRPGRTLLTMLWHAPFSTPASRPARTTGF